MRNEGNMIGIIVLYAILLVVGIVGCIRCGQMIGMQISEHLFSKREVPYWLPYILGVPALAFTIWCAYHLTLGQ